MRKFQMKKILLTLFSCCVLLIQTAWALDLTEAKNSGLVGETPSGYLEAVKSPNGAVNKLVKNINGQRKVQYEKIAKQNGTSVNAVESLAGKKAIDLTKSGNFVKVNGKWVKK